MFFFVSQIDKKLTKKLFFFVFDFFCSNVGLSTLLKVSLFSFCENSRFFLHNCFVFIGMSQPMTSESQLVQFWSTNSTACYRERAVGWPWVLGSGSAINRSPCDRGFEFRRLLFFSLFFLSVSQKFVLKQTPPGDAALLIFIFVKDT